MPSPTEIREYMQKISSARTAESDKRELVERELNRRLSTLPEHPGWGVVSAKLDEQIAMMAKVVERDTWAVLNGPGVADGPHWFLKAHAQLAATKSRLEAFREIRDWVVSAIQEGQKP